MDQSPIIYRQLQCPFLSAMTMCHDDSTMGEREGGVHSASSSNYCALTCNDEGRGTRRIYSPYVVGTLDPCTWERQLSLSHSLFNMASMMHAHTYTAFSAKKQHHFYEIPRVSLLIFIVSTLPSGPSCLFSSQRCTWCLFPVCL